MREINRRAFLESVGRDVWITSLGAATVLELISARALAGDTMSYLERLASLAGQWIGTNRLWMSPTDAARESEATATVKSKSRGQFVMIDYTWSFDGAPQEGTLLVGGDKKGETNSAVWIDSWHMQNKMMICEGDADKSGNISFKGSYAAPPGPDWGWRTSLEAIGEDSFTIVMYNITPDGEEARAVEMAFRREGE